MKKRSFTLLELLMVIAIIAILFSLLMPVLHKAKKSAYGAACLGNNSNMGKYMTLYSRDNNFFFTPGVKKNQYNTSFDDLLSPYDGRNLSQAEINQSNFAASESKRHAVYRCPSSKQTDAKALRSYSMNGGYSNAANDGITTEMGNVVKMTQVKAPSKTLMIVERDQIIHNLIGWGSGATTFYSLHYTDHDSIERSTHGNKKMAYSTCDGGARIMRMENTAFGANGNMWTIEKND